MQSSSEEQRCDTVYSHPQVTNFEFLRCDADRHLQLILVIEGLFIGLSMLAILIQQFIYRHNAISSVWSKCYPRSFQRNPTLPACASIIDRRRNWRRTRRRRQPRSEVIVPHCRGEGMQRAWWWLRYVFIQVSEVPPCFPRKHPRRSKITFAK